MRFYIKKIKSWSLLWQYIKIKLLTYMIQSLNLRLILFGRVSSHLEIILFGVVNSRLIWQSGLDKIFRYFEYFTLTQRVIKAKMSWL